MVAWTGSVDPASNTIPFPNPLPQPPPFSLPSFMIYCEGCEEWFHPECLGMSKREIDKLDNNEAPFICPSCSGEPPSLPPSLAATQASTHPLLNPISDVAEGKFDHKAAPKPAPAPASRKRPRSDDGSRKRRRADKPRLCKQCHQNPSRNESDFCSDDCEIAYADTLFATGGAGGAGHAAGRRTSSVASSSFYGAEAKQDTKAKVWVSLRCF